jgi:ATP-dependent DNA helicase PIF1
MTPAPTIDQLNPKQRECVEQIERGQNVLITGPAGTGKSFLLNFLRTKYPDLAVAASTGIAALNVGGCTLHSWASLPIDDTPAIEVAKKLNEKKNGVWISIRKTERLAIDEVSMIPAELFDKFDEVLRMVRKCDKPFGGIQIISVGDFCQLPPVAKDGQVARFAFESKSWQAADFKVFLLTEIVRQKDEEFAGILSRVRVGDSSEEVRRVLRPRINAVDGDPSITPVTLCTHNELADRLNLERLAALKAEAVSWTASDWADSDHLLKRIDKDCIAQKELTLKVGAQVMLLKNIDQSEGLVNGSIGELVDIVNGQFRTKVPVVRFANGITREIETQEWQIIRNRDVLASRRQIPLRLAYAMSIHKSQGMTIDKVRVHLAKCFADGQAYVAMSRARSLPGLFIADITGRSIRANPVALEFYRRHAA